MIAKIHYSDINREVTVPKSDCTILEASIHNKIPHLHECGGHGRCTTCRVRILEGMQNISRKTELETAVSNRRKWDPTIRLACQAHIKGDIKVQRLIWSSAQVNKLQVENVPEGVAEERPIAILFCDLRNFTQLSSHNSNFDIAWFLNRFYTELGDPILMNNGIIYQYVGDEIVGVFGIDGGEAQKNCMDAIRAAIGMQYALERLNKTDLKDFDFQLEIGIGVHFGQAYIGHLGHPNFRQFSVVGDPVNVASRIQGQTKAVGAKVLISEAVFNKLDRQLLSLKRPFHSELKGKDQVITLYELLGFRQMDLQLELQASLHLILKDEDRFASIFYAYVFEKAPFLRNLFHGSIRDQGRLLTHMLIAVVYSLSRPAYLTKGLKQLGQNHRRYGVKDEYYPIIKEAMLHTIEEVLGALFTQQIHDAWQQATDFIVEQMQKSSKKVLAH